jgi:PAS domain S-box-containing protein
VPLDGSNIFNISERAAKIFGNILHEDGRYHAWDEWAVNLLAADKEIAEKTFALRNDVFAGRVPTYDTIYAYKRPIDGRVVWIHAMGDVVRDVEGKPTDMYGVTMDITERKQAEEELKKRMEELERFIRVTINREKQMIQLKEEINLLLEEAGREQKYKIVA